MAKTAFVASSGGHLEEIIHLNKIANNHDSVIITEKGNYNLSKFCDKQYSVGQINRRELTFIFKFLFLFIQAHRILSKERPDFVITTGALMAFPFCVVAKFMGIKVIYIESFARVYDMSLTGKLVYHMADLFIVQWKEMLKKYPKAIVGGGIF